MAELAADAATVRVGIDTGGTFTDLVLLDDATGARRTIKVPSTPSRPSEAVFEALARTDVEGAELGRFVLGTTIATNCLLQRRGQRTAYVTTAGFEDVPFIQRISRPNLHDLQWCKPEPYVSRRDCIGVKERVAYDGSIRIPLADDEIDRVVAQLIELDGAEPGGIAIAVNLLFSFVEPEHERRIAAAIRERLPHAPLAVSGEVAPVWREYERASTVIVDAYLRDLVGRFAEEVDSGLEQLGVTCPHLLLKSNGGQTPAKFAGRQPANLILSGLAGGLIAGRHYAQELGVRNVITLDMGGTSTDVGVVKDGEIRNSSAYEFEFGLPISVPVVDLTTIGAGGSSIAGLDKGGLLKVGPQSAGADPGPAAYGKGGQAATVTDANLVLGRLNPGYFLGGELPLDVPRAVQAVESLCESLGLGLEETAAAIIEVTTENMANAVRLLAAKRGLDYQAFTLLAFGGAGPLHAGLLARRVGLRAAMIPPHPGLTSAFGALAADARVDRQTTRLLRSDLTTDEMVREVVTDVASHTLAQLREEAGIADGTVIVSISCRYVGQNFEHDVVVPLDASEDYVELVCRRFHEAHELAYGYSNSDAVLEFVNFNAVAMRAYDRPVTSSLSDGSDAQPVETRAVYFSQSGWTDTLVYRRSDLPSGAALTGPALIEEIDSTTLVLPDQVAEVHANGMLILTEDSAG